MAKYMCTNPDHPEKKHSKYYDQMPQDGFCPDCEYGDGLIIEVQEKQDQAGNIVTDVPIGSGQPIGLCILVCDASGSMSDPAFPPNPAKKIEMVARAAARGISDLYQIGKPDTAYIALLAFGDSAVVIHDKNNKPFVKSISDIRKEFPTHKELADFLTAQLGLNQSVNSSYTDITKALTLAHDIYQGALNGNLNSYGLSGTFTLMSHSIAHVKENKQISVPNVRILIYSDGEHNPSDGNTLSSQFSTYDPSILMSVYIGQGTEKGANEMKTLACTCPLHSLPGYFLVDNPERYNTLRGLFRMASGTSGFCPKCLRDQVKEFQGIVQ